MIASIKRNILITGASGGIGAALARAYAAPDVRLILQGRNEALLNALAIACSERGSEVVLGVFDLTDIGRLRAWIREIDAQFPLGLLIANQGVNINIGHGGEGEDWESTDNLIDVNLRATMAMVNAVIPSMRRRREGQIALVSSLAAFFGLPMTPSYCASKAGIKAYGEALRGWLAPESIGVTVIMPGYVRSDMCDAMPGPKPFLWLPERAARVMKRGIDRNSARVSFPFPLNLGTWLLATLPASVSTRILGWMGYRG